MKGSDAWAARQRAAAWVRGARNLAGLARARALAVATAVEDARAGPVAVLAATVRATARVQPTRLPT